MGPTERPRVPVSLKIAIATILICTVLAVALAQKVATDDVFLTGIVNRLVELLGGYLHFPQREII